MLQVSFRYIECREKCTYEYTFALDKQVFCTVARSQVYNSHFFLSFILQFVELSCPRASSSILPPEDHTSTKMRGCPCCPVVCALSVPHFIPFFVIFFFASFFTPPVLLLFQAL